MYNIVLLKKKKKKKCSKEKNLVFILYFLGFPGSSAGEESACNAGDLSLIPVSGRSPGEGIDYPLQYSCASLVAQMVKNLPAMRQTWVWSLGWEDPLEEGVAASNSCLKTSHGQRSLAGYSSWGRKELDMTQHSTALCIYFRKTSITSPNRLQWYIDGWNSCAHLSVGRWQDVVISV